MIRHSIAFVIVFACGETRDQEWSSHPHGQAVIDPDEENALNDLQPYFRRYCDLAGVTPARALARAELAAEFKKACKRDYPLDDSDVCSHRYRVGALLCNYGWELTRDDVPGRR
jgi:hypothetical protein